MGVYTLVHMWLAEVSIGCLPVLIVWDRVCMEPETHQLSRKSCQQPQDPPICQDWDHMFAHVILHHMMSYIGDRVQIQALGIHKLSFFLSTFSKRNLKVFKNSSMHTYSSTCHSQGSSFIF